MENFKLLSWFSDKMNEVLWGVACGMLNYLFDLIDALVALVPVMVLPGQDTSFPELPAVAQALIADLQLGPMLAAILAAYAIRLAVKSIPFVRW